MSSVVPVITLVACLIVGFVANDDTFVKLYADAGGNRDDITGNGRLLLGAASSSFVPDTNKVQHRIQTRAAKQHFCGEHLVTALSLVCKGKYNNKRFAVAPFGAEMQSPMLHDGNVAANELFEILKMINVPNTYQVPSWVISSNSGAKSRPKRGVVDECCKRPCSISTMMQYCGD